MAVGCIFQVSDHTPISTNTSHSQKYSLVHLGIDIDQFILYPIYASIGIFAVGFAAKKAKLSEFSKYVILAITCFAFSTAFFVLVPNGGAQGLAIILLLFGALLLFMARRHKLSQHDVASTKD